MDIEFIQSISVQDYLKSWRLACCVGNFETFEYMLKEFNLSEFKDYDNNTLADVNYTFYLNFYLAHKRDEKEIAGVVAYVTRAKGYLNIVSLGEANLATIFTENEEKGSKISNLLQKYIDYERSKDKFLLSDDNRLLRSDALCGLSSFSVSRKFLSNKSDEVLLRSAVVLSVELVKN